jgi:parallel beta-helix repeat protein
VRRHIETHPILLRGEMVRVDGEAFEHVFSQADLVARAGTFYIESQGLESTLWVHASTDLTQDRTTVEVSVRPTLFVANQIDHVEIRGLAFRHASTTLQDAAARIDGCSDVRVERCSFDQNSWNGLAVYQSRDVRLANVTANSNGAGGIQAWRVTDLELLDCESSHNNWRGARGDFTGWATGQKFFSIHGGRFVRYTAVGNHATGLWFDTDNRNIRLEDAHICQNDTRGVFLEASEGPFVLKNNRICDNGETGLMATGAARVSLDGNTIVENGEHQIFVPWLADEHVETTAIDYETRQSVRIRTTSWSLTNNVIGGADSALLFSVGRWPSFFDSLESDRNTWYQDGRRDGFAVYPDKGAAPERMDFEAWQLVSGQDRRSRFATRTESRP